MVYRNVGRHIEYNIEELRNDLDNIKIHVIVECYPINNLGGFLHDKIFMEVGQPIITALKQKFKI